MFNRRGEAVTTIAIVFWSVAAILSVNAVMHRDKFIIRKANEKCVADGGEVSYCKDTILAMTQDDRIEYIRDK